MHRCVEMFKLATELINFDTLMSWQLTFSLFICKKFSFKSKKKVLKFEAILGVYGIRFVTYSS